MKPKIKNKIDDDALEMPLSVGNAVILSAVRNL